MFFSYAQSLRDDFPELATAVLQVNGISPCADAAESIQRLTAIATRRITQQSEADLPEIVAWRRAFSRMGLKPTQYRCASEALLRRLRKEGQLAKTHAFVDLCNATSLAYAIPVAAFDLDRIASGLMVRRATGTEIYETFSGALEQPDPGEVIFADDTARAHARRWTNRQSGYSAVRMGTHSAIVVSEALHVTAKADVARLIDSLEASIQRLWPDASVQRVHIP